MLLAKESVDAAIADFEMGIRLDPRDVTAFGNRAYAYGLKKEYERAIADLNEALRLDPYSAAIYFKRGLARFYSGQNDAAIQDFRAAVRLQPTDAYGVIWLHLAQVRARQDDAQELTQTAAHVDRAKWPGPVVDLHLGSVSHDTVSNSSLVSADGKAQSNRACDIQFYLATFDLEEGKRPEAEQHLRAAVELCLPGGIERLAARAELDGMASR
jgi:lipoprotein NlpI